MHTPARVPSPEGDSVQQTRGQKPFRLQLAVPSGPFRGLAPELGVLQGPADWPASMPRCYLHLRNSFVLFHSYYTNNTGLSWKQ